MPIILRGHRTVPQGSYTSFFRVTWDSILRVSTITNVRAHSYKKGKFYSGAMMTVVVAETP